MTYEFMGGSGMGTAQDDPREAYAAGQRAFAARRYDEAYEHFQRAHSLAPHVLSIKGMGVSAALAGNCRQALVHFREYIHGGDILDATSRTEFYRCLEQEGQAPPTTTSSVTTTPPVTTPPVTTAPPSPGGAGVPAPEKETWWTGDVGGMFESFFLKLGIGEQAGQEAQDVARMEGAISTAVQPPSPGMAPSEPAAPGAPVRTVTPPRPWHVRYAPHMVIGGLGVGVVITLVLVMRKR